MVLDHVSEFRVVLLDAVFSHVEHLQLPVAYQILDRKSRKPVVRQREVGQVGLGEKNTYHTGFIQICSQFLTPFLGTVFHALSHGVIYCVSSKYLEMEVYDWLLKNFNH